MMHCMCGVQLMCTMLPLFVECLFNVMHNLGCVDQQIFILFRSLSINCKRLFSYSNVRWFSSETECKHDVHLMIFPCTFAACWLPVLSFEKAGAVKTYRCAVHWQIMKSSATFMYADSCRHVSVCSTSLLFLYQWLSPSRYSRSVLLSVSTSVLYKTLWQFFVHLVP